MPYLDVAVFALTGDREVLDIIIANLDHHSNQLRSSLHAPIVLVADRLSVDDAALRGPIGSGLRKAHSFNNSLLCLYCALSGMVDAKVAQLATWRDTIQLASQDSAAFEQLLTGGFLTNSLIRCRSHRDQPVVALTAGNA